MTDDHRALLLRAAVGFTLVSPDQPELKLLHRWLDCWRGVGDVVSGMKRQGYEVSLGDHSSGQWIAVFYAGHGGYQPLEAAGTAQAQGERMMSAPIKPSVRQTTCPRAKASAQIITPTVPSGVEATARRSP